MRFLRISIILLFAFSVTNAQEPSKQMPNFDFVTLKGTRFKKENLNQAHKTLIVFFDATCSHCQKAAGFFNSHLRDLKPYNVLFITMDEEKSIQLFMESYAPLIPKDENIKILRDTTRYFVPNFFPKRYPAIYVYNLKHDLQLYTNSEKDFDQVLTVLRTP